MKLPVPAKAVFHQSCCIAYKREPSKNVAYCITAKACFHEQDLCLDLICKLIGYNKHGYYSIQCIYVLNLDVHF